MLAGTLQTQLMKKVIKVSLFKVQQACENTISHLFVPIKVNIWREAYYIEGGDWGILHPKIILSAHIWRRSTLKSPDQQSIRFREKRPGFCKQQFQKNCTNHITIRLEMGHCSFALPFNSLSRVCCNTTADNCLYCPSGNLKATDGDMNLAIKGHIPAQTSTKNLRYRASAHYTQISNMGNGIAVEVKFQAEALSKQKKLKQDLKPTIYSEQNLVNIPHKMCHLRTEVFLHQILCHSHLHNFS